jgi:hypothetical protein
MKHIPLLILSLALGALSACSTVDVTKTGRGYRPPTNPNAVEILMTVPTRAYEELGSITVQGFQLREEAKMHNAVRAKAAPLGASAVIIQSQGIVPTGFGGGTRWATGVAIAWK